MATPDTSSSSSPSSAPDTGEAASTSRLPCVVMPASWRGWSLLAVFLLLIALGIWPVIGWVNQQSSLWGMPSLILWSYLIIFACSGAMLLGNRMLPDEEDGAPREDERASHE
ncbi:hypothetical protein [Cobetia sp. 5-25-4-2]|uniref:hypothetical protein n=1 Tax=Cobetia sp. 5-25-4-2 TaxID=2737459 RepID=UPI0021002DD2|nr:hypothetical protein [Cobetia sp. 5-25-4-2]